MKRVWQLAPVAYVWIPVPSQWPPGPARTERHNTTSTPRHVSANSLSTAAAEATQTVSPLLTTVFTPASQRVSTQLCAFFKMYFTFFSVFLPGVCLLEWDEGEPCDDEGDTPARDLFYYYDGEEGECVEGIGYRCGDGGNRFNTGLDCLETCDPDSE